MKTWKRNLLIIIGIIIILLIVFFSISLTVGNHYKCDKNTKKCVWVPWPWENVFGYETKLECNKKCGSSPILPTVDNMSLPVKRKKKRKHRYFCAKIKLKIKGEERIFRICLPTKTKKYNGKKVEIIPHLNIVANKTNSYSTRKECRKAKDGYNDYCGDKIIERSVIMQYYPLLINTWRNYVIWDWWWMPGCRNQCIPQPCDQCESEEEEEDESEEEESEEDESEEDESEEDEDEDEEEEEEEETELPVDIVIPEINLPIPPRRFPGNYNLPRRRFRPKRMPIPPRRFRPKRTPIPPRRFRPKRTPIPPRRQKIKTLPVSKIPNIRNPGKSYIRQNRASNMRNTRSSNSRISSLRR